MCGRFSLFDMFGLEVRFNINLPESLVPSYNIAPSQEILAIIGGGGEQERYRAQLLRWGLIPFWARDADASKKMINARAETVEKKASFKESFARRRCLIPADGFYEWKKEEGRKRPYRITLHNGELFAFAGLWDEWSSPRGETIKSCAIITTLANKLVEPVHDRMPVILAREAEAAWLDPRTELPALKELLQPYPPQFMECYEVSAIVNSPRNDRAEVVEPL